jgi:Na+-transporting NADH:ubiquinone oxidoreductase subunit E
MERLISLFVESVFVGNILLAYFLGMCSYLSVSGNLQTSFGLGLAVTFVITITTPANWLSITIYWLPAHWPGPGFPISIWDF